MLLNENELPTLPQLSNEQILDSIVGQFSFEDESSSNEKDEGQDEEIFFQTLKLLNVLKSVYYRQKNRTMLTLSRLCSFEERLNYFGSIHNRQ